MSKKIWHGDGIYSRTRQRKNGEPLEMFNGRVWIKSRRGFVYFKLGTSIKQAERRMREILGDPEGALAERDGRRVKVTTFGEVLDAFLVNHRSRGDTGYYPMITRRLRERFAAVAVADITPQAVDGYLAAMRSERTRRGVGERSLSESTLRKHIIALGTVFRWAQARGLMRDNPVAYYDKPKESSERTIAVLSPEQESALKSVCPPWVWEVAEWALYSGMRLGEVLSLRWRDLDQAREVIHTGSKTGRSRIVPLNLCDNLPAILKRRTRHVGSDLVFCERDGAPLDVSALNRALGAGARAAGIAKQRGVLWNRFRHTWATRLAATGKVSLFEVSKWMGNSVAICERHYAAYLPASFERAAGLLNAPRQVGPRVGPVIVKR